MAASGTITAPSNNNPMYLGARTGQTPQYFKGRIYSARVYNRGITDDEAIQNYNIENYKLTERQTTFITQPHNIVSDNLIASYNAIQNASSGHLLTTITWTDKNSSATKHNGTISGALWSDDSLNFDGVDDWVNCGRIDVDTNTNELTLETTFLTTATTTQQHIISNVEYYGYAIYTTSQGYIGAQIYINDGWQYFTSDIIAEPNTKYNVSITYDGSIGKLYINGNKEVERAVSGTIVNTSSNTVLAIGCNPSGTTSQSTFFKGKVYSARVYQAALTEDQVFSNYEADKQIFTTKNFINATFTEGQDESGLKKYQIFDSTNLIDLENDEDWINIDNGVDTYTIDTFFYNSGFYNEEYNLYVKDIAGNINEKNTYIPETTINYTIKYYQGATLIGSTDATYGQTLSLKKYSETSGTVPNSTWTFAGWSTDKTKCTRNYSDNQTVSNLSTTNGGVVKLYAIFKRTIYEYSGINKATTNTYTQYYNPYSTSTITSVTLNAPATISGWTKLGYRTDTTAGTNGEGLGGTGKITINPTYNSTTTKYYAVYKRTLTINFLKSNETIYDVDAESAETLPNPINSLQPQYYNTNGGITTCSFTLPSSGMTREPFEFEHWNTGSKNQGTSYSKDATYSWAPGVKDSASRPLYAVYVIAQNPNKNARYTKIQTAINSASNGDTIKILGDSKLKVQNTAGIRIGYTKSQTITLNLNDKIITGGIQISAGGNLTIIGGGSRGAIKTNSEELTGVVDNNGTLTLSSGQIINNVNNGDGASVANFSTFNMSGGTLNSNSAGLINYSGTSTLTGGKVIKNKNKAALLNAGRSAPNSIIKAIGIGIQDITSNGTTIIGQKDSKTLISGCTYTGTITFDEDGETWPETRILELIKNSGKIRINYYGPHTATNSVQAICTGPVYVDLTHSNSLNGATGWYGTNSNPQSGTNWVHIRENGSSTDSIAGQINM